MHPPHPSRIIPKPARLAAWARLWLACIAVLLTTAAQLLPSALQRRLPVLDLPARVLARYVARLILLCALEHATPPGYAPPRATGDMRALLRAGVQRHLVNAHGALDLAAIARTCANPEPAIADMVAALECGFTRRNPILPRAANNTAPTQSAHAIAYACDTS